MIRSFEGKTPRIDPSAWVSEAAYVIGDVEIGANSTVWPGTVIRADFSSITIGSNTHVEDGSILHATSPMTIGDNVTIGHGVVIHATRVGSSVLLANNSTILERVEVEDFVIVSAGAVVSPRTVIPTMSFFDGVPGRIKGQLKPEQVARLRRGGVHHGEMAARFKAEGL